MRWPLGRQPAHRSYLLAGPARPHTAEAAGGQPREERYPRVVERAQRAPLIQSDETPQTHHPPPGSCPGWALRLPGRDETGAAPLLRNQENAGRLPRTRDPADRHWQHPDRYLGWLPRQDGPDMDCAGDRGSAAGPRSRPAGVDRYSTLAVSNWPWNNFLSSEYQRPARPAAPSAGGLPFDLAHPQ